MQFVIIKFVMSTICIIVVRSSKNYHMNTFFPNLPTGEYRVYFRAILQCVQTPKTSNVKINWYLSKKSSNSTEFKGNLTSAIPFDDSIDIEINMAVKDSIGGWKDNAFLFKAPKACTTFKGIMGNSFIPVLRGLGAIHQNDCPLPAGTYVAPGMDTILLSEGSNVPKIFFYGSYKLKLYFTKNKIFVACIIFVVDVKRPWEMD